MNCKLFGKKTLALKAGSYSLLISAVVLAILVVVNIFAQVLPATWTKLDMSATQLYSVTSNTKAVLAGLSEDVTIYWIVQADQEDLYLENLLAKYEAMSGHITVEKKNPDTYPAFTQQYTDETVPNNSLIVESSQRSRYVPYDNIYLSELDYTTYSYVYTDFAGESAITSAIHYVVTEDLPMVYRLQGHGEAELPSGFSDSVDQANIQLNTLTLLSTNQVPEDADAVLIYDPQSDITEEEKKMLTDYVSAGGQLLVIAGPMDGDPLVNLNSILEQYDVTLTDGIVIEADANNYAYGYPYALLPTMESDTVTQPLIDDNYVPVIPLAQGMVINDTDDTGTVTSLLSTSATSFSKLAGYDMVSYDKEEGDIDGPFSLAVTIDAGNDGRITWFSSAMFLDDTFNYYASGANAELALNALSALVGEQETLSIRTRSLDYNYLTISESTASTLQILMIALFPLTYLGIGIGVIAAKRGKKHETK